MTTIQKEKNRFSSASFSTMDRDFFWDWETIGLIWKPAVYCDGRESDLRLVGCGFDPSYTKDFQNGTHCLPAWHSYEVRTANDSFGLDNH